MSIKKKIRFYLSYFGSPPWDTGISPPELLEFIQHHPPGKALDLGCGTGTNLITLAKSGWQVTGVDFIPKAIRLAHQKCQQAGVTASLLVGDVSRLEGIDQTFDLILDIGCFHNLSKEQKTSYLRSMKDRLAPGGTYLLYAFLRPEDGSSPRGIDKQDISDLHETFHLDQQVIGKDRQFSSAWFTFTINE
jgi:ubiquinone/menaquinone biosynthesis C-methylase UbiE